LGEFSLIGQFPPNDKSVPNYFSTVSLGIIYVQFLQIGLHLGAFSKTHLLTLLPDKKDFRQISDIAQDAGLDQKLMMALIGELAASTFPTSEPPPPRPDSESSCRDSDRSRCHTASEAGPPIDGRHSAQGCQIFVGTPNVPKRGKIQNTPISL
jgi:hypothetical protein